MFERQHDEDAGIFDMTEDKEFYYKMWKAVNDLIPKIPDDLYEKLKLGLVSLGGLGRGELDEPYVKEHQEAFRICRERKNSILVVMNHLDELLRAEEERIGCLVNSYKPPYDPESFMDAFFFAVKDNPKFVDQTWIKDPEHYKKLETAFNWWMEKFKFVVDERGVYKHFCQYEDRTRGQISFYVPGLIGDFKFSVPENILTDFGHRDCMSDMKLSISYCIPGDGCIGYGCYSWNTVCAGYTFEELRDNFKLLLDENKDTHILKTVEDYRAELKKGFEKDIERYKKNRCCFKDDQAAEYVEKLLRDMERNGITDVTKTTQYQKEEAYMIQQITNETLGVKVPPKE